MTNTTQIGRNNFFKKYKYLLLLITVVSIAAVLMMLPSILNGYFFVGGGDVKTQWFPFYYLNKITTLKALEDHTLPFYSFVCFLGNNIWASKSSYGLFDIYNILSYPLNINYFSIYDLQCFEKIVVSGIAFYLLIKYIYSNRKTAMIAGICYALSSYAIYFTAQPGFLSFYSLVPIFFLGIEKYLKEKKKLLFIIIVFLLLITNYYFFYALSLFTPVYFIYRYYNINNGCNGVIKSALLLICYYIVGVLLSGIVIVPAFFYIIQNERVGAASYSLTFEDLTIYLHVFMSSFVPSHDYVYGNNIFTQGAHTLNEILLYSGSIITLLVPQFLNDKETKFIKSTLYVYLILIVSSINPIISAAINGFSEPCFRWFFLFIIFNIIISSKYINDISLINKKNLKITFISQVVIIVGCYICGLVYKELEVSKYILQITLLITSIIFTGINVYLILKNKKHFYILTIVELTVFSTFYGNKCRESEVSKQEIENLTTVLADGDNYYYIKDYFNILDENNDKEYFRVYVPYKTVYWAFSHDLSIINNINGLMTYDSTYSQSFNKMKQINLEETQGGIDWEFDIQDKSIIDFLCTKYAITLIEEEIPFENYEIVDDSYRGSLIVSQNKDYIKFGTTYNKQISYISLANDFNNDTSLLKEYVISDIDMSSYFGDSNSSLYDIEYYDNYVCGNIDCETRSFVVLSLPYDSGWKIMINGELTDYIECNGGMMGFAVNEGHNDIEMYFVPQGFKAGAICSGVGVIALICLIILDVRKRKLS